MLAGAVEQCVGRAEESLAEADPSGRHVEEEDRWSLGMGRADLYSEPDVMRRAHQQERRKSVEEVAEAGERDLDALLRPSRGRAL